MDLLGDTEVVTPFYLMVRAGVRGQGKGSAMMGAPKCRSHTSEGYASREKSTLFSCSVLGEISFAVALTKSYQKGGLE